MIKYFSFAVLLVLINYLIRVLIVLFASLKNKTPFKENFQIELIFVVSEVLFFIFLFALSFWLMDTVKLSTKLTLVVAIFSSALIPSYHFVLAPLIYFFSKSSYPFNPELATKIGNHGFQFNIVTLKGNVTNAYASGVLPFSRTIMMGETLIEKMTEESVVALLYHEIGHLSLNHLFKLYLINLLLSAFWVLSFYIRWYLTKDLEAPFFLHGISVFILGALFGLLLWYIPGKVQYRLEMEADLFASKMVGVKNYEKALAELDALTNGDVSKGGITHPTLSKRMQHIIENTSVI